MQPSSEKQPRPALAQWMFDRDISAEAAGIRLGKSPVQVRRYCRPFGDPRRQTPSEQVIARIVEWTRGAVTAIDFYPPALRPMSPCEAVRPADEDWASRSFLDVADAP